MPRWYITAVNIEMRKYLIVLSTLVLFAFCSCNKIILSGNNITEEFSIEGTYTALCVENAFEVTVSNAVDQITVTTDENVMPKVVVEKMGDVLKIRLKPLTVASGMDLKVTLPYNVDLKTVHLSGASEFHSEYGIKGQRVEVGLTGASNFYCDVEGDDEARIELSGASQFEGDVMADEIEMELSGASTIRGNVGADNLGLELTGASDANLEGIVTNLNLNLTGSSRIVRRVIGNRYAVVCDQCEGVMSGASEAYIHCDGNIIVNLSGASKLHFTGNGNPADSSTSGGSDIIHDVNP